MASESFTPKYSVMLLVGAVGIVPFATTLRRSKEAIASWAALAFLLVGLASAATSGAPNIGIFGLYSWGTGWLMWLACAGAFGIGVRLKHADLDWLFAGLVVGAVINSLIAVYQMVARPTGALGLFNGIQSDGLFNNPVHLEALLLGAIAIVAIRSVRSWFEVAFWGAALGLMGVALEFTAERLVVLVLPVLFVALVVRGRVRGLAVSAIISVGYAIGYLGGGGTLGGRVSQGTASPGFGLRLDVWRIAFHALLHHLLIGVGPGQFEAGTAPFIGHAFALKLPSGDLFTDAHNLLIEAAVTTGILGLLCLLGWLGVSLVRARNTMVLFAIGGLAVALVEPLNIATMCLIFLALGACSVAAPSPTDSRIKAPVRASPTAPARLGPVRLDVIGGVATSILVVAALVLGITMLVGDAAYAHAPPRGYVTSDAVRANQLMPYWPDPGYGLASMYLDLRLQSHDPATQRLYLLKARAAAMQAAGRAPFVPQDWAAVAVTYVYESQWEQAERYYLRSLAYDHWYTSGLQGLGGISLERHQWSSAAYWFDREISVLTPGSTHALIETLLHDAYRHVVPASL
ncbi:MAG: O-antigen ligase family protein [Acidimicrobiales bacterium]